MFRLLEMLLALILIILFSPLFVVVAIAVVLDSGFPVFYRSPRIGQYGKEFFMYNFRTQNPDASATRVGRFIRNISIDHFPQIFNVFLGNMNIVGPRPMRPEQANMDNPTYQRVLQVKPGMLNPGIFSLGRTYNSSQFETKVDLENQYLEDRSFGKDLNFVKAILGAIIESRGNLKLRGKVRDLETDE